MRTVLIVDDHASFRAVARAVLSERFTVVGQAADGEAAVTLALEALQQYFAPGSAQESSVVILDLSSLLGSKVKDHRASSDSGDHDRS